MYLNAIFNTQSCIQGLADYFGGVVCASNLGHTTLSPKATNKASGLDSNSWLPLGILKIVHGHFRQFYKSVVSLLV